MQNTKSRDFFMCELRGLNVRKKDVAGIGLWIWLYLGNLKMKL
jgi:hypothetical protein